jgi:alpha-tubulin suppressor-like RCC1 family protein
MYALQSDGTLWLHNQAGQLVRVVGCPAGDDSWDALASGDWCDLALKNDGTLWSLGALTQIGSDTDWVAAASGYDHSAALKSTGTLWTWGANDSGQLGLGDTTARTAPTQITGCLAGDSNWVAVACGRTFSVALKSDGSLWSWGADSSGQLGLGGTPARTAPVRVTGCPGGDFNWVSVACGESFTVALKSDGSLWTWGDNSSGQLGQNDKTTRSSPTHVTGCSGGDSNWVSVACGEYDAEAVKSGGSIWAWGDNSSGNLGTGNSNERDVPTAVAGDLVGNSDWVAVACDYYHTVALKDSGGLYIWGDDYSWSPEVRIGDLDWAHSPTYVSSVGCGLGFTVGVIAGSRLLSWGDNSAGQLGDGTTTSRPAPAYITGCSGGDYNWASVACGREHALALKTDHTLWAWGANGSGQLGDGTTTERHAPVQVTGCADGDSNWAAVAARELHSAAVKTDGTLWTWGQNMYGQLGDGTRMTRSAPVQVTGCADGDTNWVAVACGTYHTVALKSDGTLWSFGLNDNGQLGDGTHTLRTAPIQVTGCPGGDTNWASVACGDKFTVAIKQDGTIWAWGDNADGELGYDTTSDLDTMYSGSSRIPQQAGTDSGWTTVQCGSYVTVALKSNGSLWAWGSNTSGELGRGTHDGARHVLPAQVGTATDWLAGFSAGWHSIVAPASDDCLWAWGGNTTGQLGDQTYAERDAPVRVPPLLGHDPSLCSWGPRLPRVAGGGLFSVALKSDSTLWAWGDNSVGELGSGVSDASAHSIPAPSAPQTTWKALAGGFQHSAGLKGDGSLWTWGANGSGQLGLGDTVPRAAPMKVTGCSGGDNNWVAVACGQDDTLALKSDGSLWAWGSNASGQLGQGAADSAIHSSPVRVGAENAWTSIACGWNHAVAVCSDGTLWAWGDNQWGQLGDGTATERDAPVQITGCPGGDKDWVAVAAGRTFTVGLKSNGSVWAWGFNGWGQLADGTYASHFSPALITGAGGDTDWIAVACGESFAAGLKSDGTLWVWGCGTSGQLGDGTTGGANSPEQVTTGSSASDWSSVACGATHTLATRSDGDLWAWGGDGSGQVGDGSSVPRQSPYQAVALSDIWAPPVLGLTSPDLPDPAKWYSDNSPTFTWSIPSDESGISGYSYTFDSNSDTGVVDDSIDTTAGSATFPSVADGVHYFHLKERDGADNWSEVDDLEVKIDTTAPTSRGGPLQTSPTTGWQNTSQVVRLTAGDASGGSGLAHIYYTVNGTEQWFTYSGPFAISAPGSHLVTFWATDNAGNSETPHHVGYVNIDTTAPVTTDNAGSAWHAGPWSLTLTPTDPLAGDGSHSGMVGGQAQTQYSLDNGVTWQVGTSVAFPRWKRGGGSGTFTVFYKSTDAAGNHESTESTTVRIDNSLPTSSAALTVPGNPATVTLTAADPDSGVACLWYSLDGGVWTQVTYPGPAGVPLSISGLGAHTLCYYAVDTAGNSQAGYNVIAVTITSGGSHINAKLAHRHRQPHVRRRR